jgi:hypothetical protein
MEQPMSRRVTQRVQTFRDIGQGVAKRLGGNWLIVIEPDRTDSEHWGL